MPRYAYRCPACETFEDAAAADRAACPRCGAPAPRLYTAPGGRSPRRARELDRMGGGDIRRMDRAAEGKPTVGPMPAGRRVTGGGPGPQRPPARRPWTMGH